MASILLALIFSDCLENIRPLTLIENICRECNGFERELEQLLLIVCFTRQCSSNRRRAELQKGMCNLGFAEKY